MEWSQALMADAESTERWPESHAEFELLVERMQHALVRFALRRLHSQADAEDVVQDVLVRSYLDRARLARITAVEPYLYRMTANRCTDLLRKRGREAPLAAAGGAPDPRLERWERIDKLLDQLPEREAEAIRLRVFGDLPFDQAAQAAGVSTPTLKSRFRYGVERLRRLLGTGEVQR